MLGFGGAALSGEGGGYGFGTIDKPEELLECAVDSGIKLFDTAPIYGFGQSEKILGEFFEKSRDQVKICSKAGVTWHSSGRVNMTNEPKIISQMLEQSLKDLRSDYIDIYMIHWPDEKVDIRYSVEVLANAQARGKVIDIGLCNTNFEEISLAKEVCEIKFVQSECNLFRNLLPELDENITSMGWGVFDKGILSRSVGRKREFEKSDCRSWAPWWKKSNWKEKVEKVEVSPYKNEIKKLALHSSINEVDYVLVGAKSVTQLEEIIQLIKNKPDQSQILEAREYFRD